MQQPRAKKLLGSALLGPTVLSCQDVKQNANGIYQLKIPGSPLNTILGEKVLDLETEEIRRDNFESFLKLYKSELYRYSLIYQLDRLSKNYYQLRQKKKYLEARNFDALIIINDSVVIDYCIFEDFNIIDCANDSERSIVLLSDCHQTNINWKSNNVACLAVLDGDFKGIWSKTFRTKYATDGNEFHLLENGNYAVLSNVIKGSQMPNSTA